MVRWCGGKHVMRNARLTVLQERMPAERKERLRRKRSEAEGTHEGRGSLKSGRDGNLRTGMQLDGELLLGMGKKCL